MWYGSALKAKAGAQAGIEGAYTFLTNVGGEVEVGLRAGAGVSYQQTTLTGEVTDSYTNVDFQGHPMLYENSTNVKQQHNIYSVDVPLMAAINIYGFTMLAGARAEWLLKDNYEQKLSNPVIRATYTEYGVTMVNRLVSGVLSEQQCRQTGENDIPRFRLQVGGEIGYSHVLFEGYDFRHRVAVMLYAYYDVFSACGAATTNRFIDVAPIISATSPAPTIRVGSMGAYTSDLRNLQVGIRLAYSIETIDYQRFGWHNYRRRR